MFRRHYHISRTEESVGSCREDLELFIGILYLKVDIGAVALADPVALHCLHLVRPALELVEAAEQPVGIICDLEIPLGEVLLRHFSMASLALPVDHLLVSQNSLAARTPVDRIVLLVCQSFFVELDEYPLSPFVVLRRACSDLAVPVIRKAHGSELFVHFVHIVEGPLRRLCIVLYGGVFCRKTEGIVSHRMKDVESRHLLVSCDNISYGIVSDMSHVELAARIREHLENVVFLFVRIFDSPEGLLISPDLLPLRFNFSKIVFVVTHFFLLLLYC